VKKKPSKPERKMERTLTETGMILEREASASVSLDGGTQFCEACAAEQHGLPTHTCGKQAMTAEEGAVVEAAMALTGPGAYGPGQLHEACRALRARGWKP
jgi:hypothetical protein